MRKLVIAAAESDLAPPRGRGGVRGAQTEDPWPKIPPAPPPPDPAPPPTPVPIPDDE